jgi:hypothetical protein
MNKTDFLLILKIAGVSLEHLVSEKIIARDLGLTEPEIARIYAIIQKSITEEA